MPADVRFDTQTRSAASPERALVVWPCRGSWLLAKGCGLELCGSEFLPIGAPCCQGSPESESDASRSYAFVGQMLPTMAVHQHRSWLSQHLRPPRSRPALRCRSERCEEDLNVLNVGWWTARAGCSRRGPRKRFGRSHQELRCRCARAVMVARMKSLEHPHGRLRYVPASTCAQLLLKLFTTVVWCASVFDSRCAGASSGRGCGSAILHGRPRTEQQRVDCDLLAFRRRWLAETASGVVCFGIVQGHSKDVRSVENEPRTCRIFAWARDRSRRPSMPNPTEIHMFQNTALYLRIAPQTSQCPRRQFRSRRNVCAAWSEIRERVQVEMVSVIQYKVG